MYQAAEQIYQELIHHMDDRNSEVSREHLQKKLFPPMAYYKALLSEGYDRETALAYVKKETHKASCVKKRGNA